MINDEMVKPRRIPAAVILAVSLITCLALIFGAAENSRAGNSYRVGGRVRGLTGEHKVYISIYTDEANYKDGIAMKSIIIHPEKIKEGKAEYYFLIPEGEYMIMVFEDRNGDGKLNYGGVFNTPREPYGFYRRFRPFLNSPSFDRLRFKLDKEIRDANINLIKK